MDDDKLTVLDTFSGIGGFSLGLERTGGFRTTAFCEIDPFCRRVLKKHWPDVACFEDVKTMEFHHGQADVICGGFPCQDLSNAGKRAGLSGERSGLYRELVRAIRVVRPIHAIMENVAALLGSGMGTVLGDLAESGYDTEWDCVPAQAVGAPHQRDRVWIVAHADGMRESQQAIPGKAIGVGCGIKAQKHYEESSDSQSVGCGERRAQRPPDSFAWIRDEARRNASDPYSARLAFGEGFNRNARSECEAVKRDADEDVIQSIWPDEPALLGVDDGVPERVDRIKSLGNTVVPQIPEMISNAILAARKKYP